MSKLRGPSRGIRSRTPQAWELVYREPATLRLDNGLQLAVLERPGVPLVATALWYRVGTRDEGGREQGIAHFLEHMMFKGSERFGAGEVDRRTQRVGGSNNAFTSHDGTVYHFTLPAASWQQALEIEADRCRGLRLDPAEVDREREVVIEEIGMYQDEPWDALEQQVMATLYGAHPYGAPILGTASSLSGQDREELGDFHARFYRPGNAVLAVVGDVSITGVVAAAEELFEARGAVAQREPVAAVDGRGQARVERRAGDVARCLIAMRGPGAEEPEHPVLRLLTAILAGGRLSRLHQVLVEREQLCPWVSCDLSESQGPSTLTIAFELHPEVSATRAETLVMAELEKLRSDGPTEAELERCRRQLYAELCFHQERCSHQAISAGMELALFRKGHSRRSLESMLECASDQLARALGWLQTERHSAVGWSLPAPARVANR